MLIMAKLKESSKNTNKKKITKDDVEYCWPYATTYLAEILNGSYDIDEARRDLLSLVGSKYDPRSKDFKEEDLRVEL
jgi:hypothetical protein